jgi:two-component system chemotaxis response regulator CheB
MNIPPLPTGLTVGGSQPTYAAVAIGGSAGALPALLEILAALPATFLLPIVVALHLPKKQPSYLAELLAERIALSVSWGVDGTRLHGGHVYVAPANCAMRIGEHGRLRITASTSINRPPVDPLLESMADVFGRRSVAVILSGLMRDGARGIAAVRARGGITIAQDPRSAFARDMPVAAIDLGGADISLSPRKIAAALSTLAEPRGDAPSTDTRGAAV